MQVVTGRVMSLVGGALFVGAALACSGAGKIGSGGGDEAPKAVELSAEDLAGEHFAVGAKVKAIRGKETKTQSAKVVELYGKLAKLSFADYNTGWVLVKSMEPVGAIQPLPEGDSCSASIGDRVMAPWSTSLSKWAGEVDEIHGKMAHLKYDDGERDWAECAKFTEIVVPAPSSGGGAAAAAAAAAVTKCQRGCTSQCKGSSNTAKCTGSCRRACEGK